MAFGRVFFTAILTAIAALFAIDLVFENAFPHFVRLADNFSSRYLQRAFHEVDGTSVVYLGDSALWGYGIASNQTAIALLRERGRPVRNLSYEGGSPANTYAVLRALLASGARPKAVVFNVNLKEFNAEDSAYQRLEPSVESVAWPLLSSRQRARLVTTTPSATTDSRVDALLSTVWALYGMRADLRYALFGDVDAAHALNTWIAAATGSGERTRRAHVATADRFEGTYDLSPIDEANVSMAFLEDTIALLRARKIRTFAILTPTNHTLLHQYIDVPEYGANIRAVSRKLAAGGVGVIDYDDRFAASEFIDNDHLTAAGNVRLAELLERDVRP